MLNTNFQNDISKLNDITRPGRPLISLEVNPPHGADITTIFERLEGKIDHLDFFNVTDSALARMKLAALPFAAILKQKFGIEPLVNISCRDRNLIALQGDLLAAWLCGIRSVIALTGDAMSVGDSPDVKGVFEVNSIGLLNLIKTLNGGKDLAGKPLDGPPSFVSGVVVNPNAKNSSAELRRLEKKFKAGGSYALTQPVFDLERAVGFLKEVNNIGIPLFLGLLPFRTAKSALLVSEQVPGIRISQIIEDRLKTDPEKDCSEFFIEHCLRIADATKELVRGFHIVSGITPKLGLKLSKLVAKKIA